ncbi:MAG: nuclear transport factor 2 family protein [Acidobacteria bacterium]|nr:nuclear transport factor 2 family protein [Acidobacteriota bacterium]
MSKGALGSGGAVPAERMDEIKALEKANQDFYEALQALSLERMDRVWLHEGWVKCIHPGWDVIEGWPGIRHSWENIFRSTEAMKIAVTQASIQVQGDMAIVVCTENISSYTAEGVRSGLALATNLFLRREDQWLLIHHHASPVSIDDSVIWNDTVQ